MNAQQLKNSILQEAIEGRLVPQDPNDEPASVLLDRIRKEKAQLVKAGKLKKKNLEETPIAEDEKPFDIPESWEWVRWGMLGEYKKGPFGSSLTKSMFVPKTDDAVKVYEQKNAIQKDYSLGDYYISKEKYETMKGFTVNPSDIIVSCAGTIGETYLLPQDAPVGIINQALMRARLHLDSIIPYWLLNFRYILLIENKLKGSGSAIKNIPPFEVLKAMPVPLPPLAEQQRIVAKIEELLPKVEEYGKAQEALDKLNTELPERMKKSILQEAIEGRLVPQDPNDEPASVLLDRIRKEKAQLVKAGKLKKKDLEETPIAEDEKPFEIPESWEWCHFGEIVNMQMGKTPPRGDSLHWLNGTDSWVSISDMKEYGHIQSTREKVSKYAVELVFKNKSPEGTLLMSFKLTVGRTSILDIPAFHNEAIISIYPYVDTNNSFRNYLFYLLPLLSNLGDSKDAIKGKTLNSTSLNDLLIPLPPLAEQHRIVAKIEELLVEIDKMKEDKTS